MRLITRTFETNRLNSAFAFAFVALGAGCSSSDGASPADGGGTSDAPATGTMNPPDGSGGTSGASDLDARTSADGAIVAVDGAAGTSATGAGAVALGMAANYAILAKTGISTATASAITGNIGISPAAATYLTGFALTADSTNVFSTSPQIVGMAYASDYAVPTPSNLTTAIQDMQLAFTDAAGRAPSVTELGSGDIGGMTLRPGVYEWSSGVTIPTSVTLSGSATDVWIFQIAQNLMLSAATNVVLTGGAAAKNVFWEVAGTVDLGTTAHFAGIALVGTSIAVETGAVVNGRLLSQTAVTLDASTVVAPAP